MTQAQTQTLRFERLFDCTPEALYRAWTDPKLYARWFNPFPGVDAEIVEWDARVGGRVKFFMVTPDGQKYENGGRFTELTPYSVVETGDDVGDMRTRVTFERVGDRTRMVVVQTGLPMTVPVEQATAGWNAILDRLPPVVEKQA